MPTFQSLVEALPPGAQAYLNYQLDAHSRGLDTDLIAIARPMLEWEEGLANCMGLSRPDIHDIKNGQYRDRPELQRYDLYIIISKANV